MTAHKQTGGGPETETRSFDSKEARGQPSSQPSVKYRPVPHDDAGEDGSRPVWRVRFELASEPNTCFGLDINGNVVFGRGKDAPGLVDLSAFSAEELGISRRHAELRPTTTKLYVLDLGSTNGTQRNGRSIGVNTPYSLTDGDVLAFSNLEFVVRIVKRPTGHTAILHEKADLGDALAQLAKAITAELDLDEVLSQALEMAMGLTQAGETAIWLVDEQTGELFLEAERGIEEEKIRRMRLPVTDTLAGGVIETKEPLRTSREPDSEKVKIKTDYLVEAVVYVPLTLGGVAFGVLAAAHREPGNAFSARDEQLMSAIADFAAIAIQNSRLYEATDKALASRIEDLATLNHALAHDLRGLMASINGYAELLKLAGNLNERDAGFASNIISTSKRTLRMVDQLLDITFLTEAPPIQHAPFDLADAVSRAVADLEGAALVKSMELDFKMKGTPYQINGDATLLYRSALNLIDNAIKYSPENTKVSVVLTFRDENVTVQVRDKGTGIPEEDLPRLFDKYFRGRKIASGELGMGLGLHMVKSTVDAHGGEITARNVEGSGAEFTITLPASMRVE